MNDQGNNVFGPGGEPPKPPSGPNGPGGPGFYSEQLQHKSMAAKLPEGIGEGVFCTGAIVLEGPEEFVVDFVQGVARPPRVGARVVMSPRIMAQFLAALKDDLARYEQQFGPPKPLPKPNMDRRPSIQEVYDDLKLPDDELAGHYANTVMIGHSPAEFFFDFIARFFPKAAVAARVFLSASQVPRVFDTLNNSFGQYLKRVQSQGGPPSQPGQPGPGGPPSPGPAGPSGPPQPPV